MAGRRTPKRVSRRDSIIDLVREQGFASIDYLARYFRVTPQTVRRDINALCAAGVLQRFHGGAGLARPDGKAPEKTRADEAAKQQIAAQVAARIFDGSSLFLGTGSTVAAVAYALRNHRNLRIVTNSLPIAQQVSDNTSFEVTIVGGQVRSTDKCVVGEAALELIKRFRVDIGIIGASAIEADGALLDCSYQGARLSQAIIENSRRTFLVATENKFGKSAMARLGFLSQVDSWFTDKKPAGRLACLLASHHVDVVFASEAEVRRGGDGAAGSPLR
ncbi:DeoR/GlpR transcriptional regulator [Proteobacteria bacterium 005FR1]|nr:DeoR/GlpR transcriptional regulator [Proteobacteria bacterium 005FR1]